MSSVHRTSLGAFFAMLALSAGVLTGCSSSPAAMTTAQLRALPAVPSPGCQKSSAASTTFAPLRTGISFTHGPVTGTYLLSVPSQVEHTTPTPLVLNVHGYEEPISIQDAGSGLPAFGASHNFFVLTPAITESGVPRWNFSKGSNDVAWLSALLQNVESSACVDLRRVYATGLSLGAYTVSSLACQLSSSIAAVAPVAGIQAYPWCQPTRPVPVIAFHGDADPILAYQGGLGPAGKALPTANGTGSLGDATSAAASAVLGTQFLKSVPTQAAEWAKRNGCGTPAVSTKVSSDTTRLSYPCAADSSVVLYTVHGGGHSWPGGPPGVYPESIVGKETQTISADALMWRFFLDHPLFQVATQAK